jgi:hypothetical protein
MFDGTIARDYNRTQWNPEKIEAADALTSPASHTRPNRQAQDTLSITANRPAVKLATPHAGMCTTKFTRCACGQWDDIPVCGCRPYACLHCRIQRYGFTPNGQSDAWLHGFEARIQNMARQALLMSEQCAGYDAANAWLHGNTAIA